MKIPIQFANLIKPLFLNRRNFGEKLGKEHGLVLEYDMARKELYVLYNGRVAIVPSSGLASIEPTNPKDVGYDGEKFKVTETHVNHPALSDIGRAQVSTPHGYVFEGPGKGKTKS